MNRNTHEAVAQLQTLADMVRWAVSCFNEAQIFLGHGTDNSWDEALSLILPTLHLNYDIPESIWQARLTTSEVVFLIELIKRRTHERFPTAYLTHTAQFADFSFYVDSRVLIPRSSLAEWILKRFSPWLIDNEEPKRILDLCTGSACIAIACAHYFPEAIIDAVDISSDALDVAQINIQRHHLENRVFLHQGDVWEALTPPYYQYDVIISNPPYVDAVDIKTLPKEYSYEPLAALVGGEDGLDLVKEILFKSIFFLKPQGILIMEVGNSEKALMEQFPEIPFVWLECEKGDGGIFLLTYESLYFMKGKYL